MKSSRPSEPPKGDQADIQAVSRVSQILALFEPGTPELSTGEVADRLNLNRTTAYRYCTSLVAAGLLERSSEPGRFIPGGLLLQLGAFAIGRRRVVNLAPRHLQALSRSTQMTAVLSLWGLTGPVVARAEEDTATIVVVSVRVGSHLPLNAAQSKVFVAYHSDQLSMERLLATLPNTPREQLRKEIDAVRAAGHCSASSTPGVVAVAAPVFDEYGICATVAVIGTDNTLSISDDAPELRQVVDTARQLTNELGGSYLPDKTPLTRP
ncbi:IclR family transcriptional regulator [Actinacidiphila oryziradicis]|uniref:IclR family transcriptional regulator n=1 Tax=Actinacidiphila oryziradicis TaxID=2571141 RepID=A0A4V5MZQ3_9ACTN|nr:IclR family transcriptional regulator [Actinacidiphila oryziradicis]TJZ98958.1 IclR family transcriptional regulator [Actinacidiphila oryziradicis]